VNHRTSNIPQIVFTASFIFTERCVMLWFVEVSEAWLSEFLWKFVEVIPLIAGNREI
jgi:hypothetical protein